MSLVADIATIAAANPQRALFSRPRGAVAAPQRLGSWRTHPVRCHAGACHAPAVVFGLAGPLCWPCAVRMIAVMAKLRGA